ncbi:MAG TPA: methylglyoxal synthase, partial [Candidatus Ratteibacteria bacterium]|nr:methylglyoxal synthase [Candidatus Ratteibacteria bacterium]
MNKKKILIDTIKNIGLIAHDNQKTELLEWAKFNRDVLKEHKLFATGTTGNLLEKELNLKVTAFK